MVKKSTLSCPQCLHQNSSDAIKCSLCDWSLESKQLDETRMPEETGKELDPDRTIAPDLATLDKNDPDLTQAPLAKNSHSSSTKHSVSEKQTFLLAGDLAHFEIHKILGQGGMGAVYHAKLAV